MWSRCLRRPMAAASSLHFARCRHFHKSGSGYTAVLETARPFMNLGPGILCPDYHVWTRKTAHFTVKKCRRHRFIPSRPASAVSDVFKSTPSAVMSPRKVTIVGSGNWGSAIARIIGKTTQNFPHEFDPNVRMWVFEEMVGNEKLSDIINTQHENVKYLPGKKIPPNVVAVPDLLEACDQANILVFVVPHQFVRKLCQQLDGKLCSDVHVISLIKGISAVRPAQQGLAAPYAEKLGGVKLISDEIKEILKVNVSVLMGANLAHEVAADDFCEATIGCKTKSQDGGYLKRLFNTDNFRINVVEDAHTVELCGALKNIVGCAAGFTDGLGYGDNTKAAVIRIGLIEMTRFIEHFYPGSNLTTFFESCGVADLITTCYGGRNRKVCEAFVKSNKTLQEVEKELLGGQSAQGPLTADEVYFMTQRSNLSDKYPLFTAVHRICKGEMKASEMISCIRDQPEYP